MKEKMDSSDELWSGIKVWYPPGDPNGAEYTTEYVETTEKIVDGKTVCTANLKLIPVKKKRCEI